MRHKASFASGPLARPETPIYKLAAKFQSHLYFPDPSPLYALMGAVAANMMKGKPIWLMLIGPPACGGSALLRTLESLPHVRTTDAISGEAALLSGTKKKDFHKDAAGGLLREIGEYGALVLEDFTSVLSLPTERMKEVVAAFRKIYDGEWTRTIGGEGGRSLAWGPGKICVVTKATPVLDRYVSSVAPMGERFIQYRYPMSGGSDEARRSLRNGDERTMIEDLQADVMCMYQDLKLTWHAEEQQRPFDLTEENRMLALAEFSVAARSPVMRDPYSKEIIDVAATEYPSRVANELGALYRGMERIGVEPDECWRVVAKIAIDSMTSIRRAVLAEIACGKGTPVGIAESVRVANVTVKRALEDLTAQRVVVPRGVNEWQLSEWALDRLRVGWGGPKLAFGID